jgi:RHS repeat-associated protein
MAVGRDGTIYTSDIQNVIRRIGADGIIRRFAGDSLGDYCYGQNPDPTCGDGGPAREAKFDGPADLAIGPDGSVYVVGGNARVRRITPDGIIRTVAGNGVFASSGDGGLATQASVVPFGIAVTDDGSLFILDASGTLANYTGPRIRRVGTDGIIATIGGVGLFCQTPFRVVCPANRAPPEQVRLKGIQRIAVSPNGEIYFSQHFDGGDIRRISPFFRSFDGNGFTIASEDGGEVFEFDASGRHLRTRDAMTKRILFAFGYNGAGRLATVTDGDGNVTTLERNGAGAVSAIVSPFGQRTATTFDTRGYLATLTNPAGEVITTQHDSLGLLRSLRDAKNNLHSFVYDSVGRLTRDEAPGGALATLARAETDTSIAVTLSSALGRTETFRRILLPNGTIRRLETDRAGSTTQIDARTNGTTTTSTPDGMLASTTDSPDPRFGLQAPLSSQFSVQTPGGLQLSGSAFRRVTLANASDPTSLTSQIDSLVLNGRTFRSVFDAAARTLTRTSAEGRQSVTQLDTLGRVAEERVSGVAPVRYSYGPRGFLTTVTQAGRVMRYDYDSGGRVKKVTDPLGRFEQYAYDSVGRVRKQTLFNGSEILYGYDANGNLTSLTPPGKPAHTFAYTAANLDSVYAPPPAGLPVSATRYTFNPDRQLTRVLRPDSLAIDIAYDTAGRPRRLTLPNGQVQFAYSPTSGNLTTLTAADGGTLTYGYDGALPTSATWAGTVQGSVGIKYDSDFRVSKIAVNGTDSVAFGYNRDNLLTSAGAMTLARDSQNGRLVRTVLASDTSFWSHNDSTGAVLRYTAKHGPTTLFDVEYARDSLERITQAVETVQGVTTTKAFTYDSLGRLDHVRVNGTLISDYAYDENGNRGSLTTQAGTVSGTYDDQDRVLTYGGASYTHTANGERKLKIIGSDTTRYTYDVLGNLAQVRSSIGGDTVEYMVDAKNRRVGKKVNGTLVRAFLYQNQLAPIAELDSSGQVVSRFVYATRPTVPDYLIRGGMAYRLITDYLGSVRLVVNTATGQVVQRLDYDEFGRITADNNPDFQPFGFAGGMVDASSPLVHFGARDYDPETGRWTAKDPAGFQARSTNLFAYVSNDPTSLIDPSGLCDSCDKPAPEGRVVFVGESGTLSPGYGGSVSAGMIVWSASGPGLYLTGAGGFGGDVGYGTTVGTATSLGAFTGASEGFNLGLGPVSAGQFTNASGTTTSVTIGPRAPIGQSVYPLSMSVQKSYTFAITARDIICAFLRAGNTMNRPREAFKMDRLERIDARDR